VINRSDFTEGLIALRLIRRIDHTVIDLKDFTEGLIAKRLISEQLSFANYSNAKTVFSFVFISEISSGPRLPNFPFRKALSSVAILLTLRIDYFFIPE